MKMTKSADWKDLEARDLERRRAAAFARWQTANGDAVHRANPKAAVTTGNLQNLNAVEKQLSAEGLDFLQREIASASGPVVVFCHQRLDVDDHYAPRNAADVRRILEASGGKVKAVFTGHHHVGGESVVGGIPYYSIKAVIEGENSAKPLSDEAISAELKRRGYDVARRTVAKYRNILGIMGVAQRRKK